MTNPLSRTVRPFNDSFSSHTARLLKPVREAFIGTALNADALHRALDTCLVRPGESAPQHDPFPAWDVHDTDNICEHERMPG